MKLWCFLRGHDWNVLRVNVRKNINLCHLSTLAGTYAVCRRCGQTFDDLWSTFFSDEIVETQQPLPRAMLR